jgi:hypothetical protein
LEENRYGFLMGLNEGRITATPLSEAASRKKRLDLHLLELAQVLAK